MSQSVVRYLGWALWLLDVAVIAASIMMLIQVHRSVQNGSYISEFALEASFIAFSTVGALIIWHRPSNTVGWIFCVLGLGTAWTSFSAAFVQHALATHTDTSALVGLVDAFGNIVWPMNLGLGILLLYLFPTGRLPSPRWRVLFWLTVIALLLDMLASGLTPGSLESNNRVPNPLGIPAAADLLNAVSNISHLVIIPCALAAVISIIVRYIQARDIQRQQIKWFAVGVIAMAVIITATSILVPQEGDLSNVAFGVAFAMIPIGAGIGILRYRLFDIDVIINRTLVYGSLTVVLAAVYIAGVVGVQNLINVVTGRALSGQQGSQSPVLIVITTLVVAALFQPLRRRIQQFIDRRFYRSRYDARKTLDMFGTSLRSEVELARLTDNLLETVERTMRPAHVSLWLRQPEGEGLR